MSVLLKKNYRLLRTATRPPAAARPFHARMPAPRSSSRGPWGRTGAAAKLGERGASKFALPVLESNRHIFFWVSAVERPTPCPQVRVSSLAHCRAFLVVFLYGFLYDFFLFLFFSGFFVVFFGNTIFPRGICAVSPLFLFFFVQQSVVRSPPAVELCFAFFVWHLV